MNCKPGDLAIVVRNLDGNVGKLLHVERPFPKPGWWICTPLGTFHTADVGDTRGLICAADSALRPIRGDGVTDDEVTELYAPSELVVVR